MATISSYKSIVGRLLGIDSLTGVMFHKASNALTALAGGGQSGATALPSFVNRITTVASAADSVLLPPARVGAMLVVVNAAAANSMNVFPASGDAVNALSANAAYAMAANKTAIFVCAVAGTWNAVLTA